MTTQTHKGVDKFATVGSLRLHYLEWGSASNPPLVLIHGLTGNAHNFDRLAPHLTGKYHLLSLDVRGRGDSDWAVDGDYSNEAYVRDLEGFRAALGLERCSLIGTSMGGRIGTAYAGAYPQRVVRAVINDIAPEVDPRGGQRIAGYVASSPQRFASADELLAWYRVNYPQLAGMSDAEFREYVGWQVKPHPQGGLTWKMDPAVRASPRRPDAAQTWALAKAITAPVLLVRGASSDILPPELARRMVAELRDCRLVEVPGVGHAPSLLEPEALTAVKAFLGVS